MKKVFCLVTFIIVSSFNVEAQTAVLKQQIEQFLATKKAKVGVSVVGIESKEAFTVNATGHYPLQSVFKFHLALAVLNQVDKGILQLNQKIVVKKNDLLLNTWSPIREAYPAGDVEIPLSEILKYTVALSDNNGCDILLRLIGGPKVLNTYLHKLGIKDVAITVNEEDMQKDWDTQFTNWSTPKAATDLLLMFYRHQILSQSSFDFLWRTMVETTTGKKRIKGQLPEGTIVAHKTGTSGTNTEGITAAVNDIGIVTLPNNQHFAISIFVANSKENTDTNEQIIAEITQLTWAYFVH
jgi:beta-lactamase class A